MTTKSIRVDYVQVTARVLDAISDTIELGIPEDVKNQLKTSIELIKEQMEKIAFSKSHREFTRRAFHVTAQVRFIESTVNAEARACVAIAVARYVEAILKLLNNGQNDFDYEDEMGSYIHL